MAGIQEIRTNRSKRETSRASITVRPMLIAFNKPFGVLSQFTPDGSPNRPLAEFHFPAEVYPIGRLDADSEGLLLLSDEPHLTEKLLEPKAAHPRVYHAQVEGVPTPEKLRLLASGVVIQGYKTRPCQVAQLSSPRILWERIPPIRFRKSVPTTWLQMELVEGKNRQVRRMTAAIGHPTLRLVRIRIGQFDLGDLPPGKWRRLTTEERRLLFH